MSQQSSDRTEEPWLPEPWLPFPDAAAAQRMRQMLDRTFTGFTGWPAVSYADAWTPPLDVEETNDAYLLEAELPGIRRNDVDIEIVGNELSITGDVKKKEREGVVRHSTRRTGRFGYRITLPQDVDATKVDAKLVSGVLTVRVPKSQPAQHTKIELRP